MKWHGQHTQPFQTQDWITYFASFLFIRVNVFRMCWYTPDFWTFLLYCPIQDKKQWPVWYNPFHLQHASVFCKCLRKMDVFSLQWTSLTIFISNFLFFLKIIFLQSRLCYTLFERVYIYTAIKISVSSAIWNGKGPSGSGLSIVVLFRPLSTVLNPKALSCVKSRRQTAFGLVYSEVLSYE